MAVKPVEPKGKALPFTKEEVAEKFAATSPFVVLHRSIEAVHNEFQTGNMQELQARLKRDANLRTYKLARIFSPVGGPRTLDEEEFLLVTNLRGSVDGLTAAYFAAAPLPEELMQKFPKVIESKWHNQRGRNSPEYTLKRIWWLNELEGWAKANPDAAVPVPVEGSVAIRLNSVYDKADAFVAFYEAKRPLQPERPDSRHSGYTWLDQLRYDAVHAIIDFLDPKVPLKAVWLA